MIYLPLSLVREGMVLARAVSIDPASLPLIVQGQTLSATMIRKLGLLDIAGIYIESELSENVEVEELIEPTLKKKMAVELKDIYKQYIDKASISYSSFDSMTVMVGELLDSVLSKEECLMNIIEIKDYDNYTYSHSIYVGTLVALIGTQLNYTRPHLTNLTMAGLLHDIGKLDLPLDLVNKRGTLTLEEVLEMQSHPRNAVQRLEKQRNIPQMVLRGIESHHEKYDGSGYPFGLIGEDIPEAGRILAVADVYDALTSKRSYRSAWPANEAVEYIMGCSGTHFDPQLLSPFLRTIAAYPVGTLVKLSNGEIGLVIKNTVNNVLRPVIRLISPDDRQGAEIDLESDRLYLNVTIIGTVKDPGDLPSNII